MRALGWSCQKPAERARERDEKAIVHWKRWVWPHIKTAERSHVAMLFLDESGFLAVLHIARTKASGIILSTLCQQKHPCAAGGAILTPLVAAQSSCSGTEAVPTKPPG